MFFEKEINQDVLLYFVEKSVSIESYRKESSQFLKQIQYAVIGDHNRPINEAKNLICLDDL